MKFDLLKSRVLAGIGAGLLMLGATPVPNVSAAGSDDESDVKLDIESVIGDDDYLLDLLDDEPVAEPTVESAAEPAATSVVGGDDDSINLSYDEMEKFFSLNADEVRAVTHAVTPAEKKEVKIKVNFYRRSGYTPLTRAVDEKRLDIVQILLNAGANPNINDGNSASTALHHAAEGGKVEIVEALLNAGANPNVSGLWRKTPLHLAAQKGYLVIFKLLIDHGANPFACDSDGHTPLECFAENNNLNGEIARSAYEKLLNVILALEDHYERLSSDVLTNDIGDIRRCLEADSTGLIKNIALSEAAKLGKLDIVRELIVDHHANVDNFCNGTLMTPLHLAAKEGHLEVVKLLIDNGANLRVCTAEGKLPWHLAKENGHEEVAGELSAHFGGGSDFAVRVRLG